MASCYHCGIQFPDDFEVHRSTECPSCGKDVKVCRNCRFYSPGAHWDCRETIPEPVQDKEKANFCGYFSLNPESLGTRKAPDSKRDEALSRFNDLFKND